MVRQNRANIFPENRIMHLEGLLRSLYDDRYEVYGGGTNPLSVNPYAVKVMTEIGIGILALRSKSVDKFLSKKI